MRVGVYGLGYVGAVIAACLSDMKHDVLAIDVNPDKVALVNRGESPIDEPGVGDIIRRNVECGRLRAISDARHAVCQTDISIVCVGTPSGPDGDVALGDLERVCAEIGAGIGERPGYHVVMISSTIPPGTSRNIVIPAVSTASGKHLSEDFGVVMSPEFLREGSAVSDLTHPARVVIGASDERAASVAASLYTGIEAPVVTTALETAEMVKLTDNAWHATKVAFANEVGRTAAAFGVDPGALAEIFLLDKHLNISERYLRPGFAFGGSCLPKDLRTLTYRGGAAGVELPLLNAILPSNEAHLRESVARVLATGRSRVTVLGLAFKADTDDLRESPGLELVARLRAAGCDVRAFDPHVAIERLVGANLAWLRASLPDAEVVVVGTLGEALAHGDTVVVANGESLFRSIEERLSSSQVLVDLNRSSRGDLGHGPSA